MKGAAHDETARRAPQHQIGVRQQVRRALRPGAARKRGQRGRHRVERHAAQRSSLHRQGKRRRRVGLRRSGPHAQQRRESRAGAADRRRQRGVAVVETFKRGAQGGIARQFRRVAGQRLRREAVLGVEDDVDGDGDGAGVGDAVDQLRDPAARPRPGAELGQTGLRYRDDAHAARLAGVEHRPLQEVEALDPQAVQRRRRHRDQQRREKRRDQPRGEDARALAGGSPGSAEPVACGVSGRQSLHAG